LIVAFVQCLIITENHYALPWLRLCVAQQRKEMEKPAAKKFVSFYHDLLSILWAGVQ